MTNILKHHLKEKINKPSKDVMIIGVTELVSRSKDTHSLIRSALQGGVCLAAKLAELSPTCLYWHIDGENITACPQAWGSEQNNISAKEASEQMREHMSCVSAEISTS